MKTYFKFILVIISLLILNNANAAGNVARLRASFFANKLSQITEANDLLKFNLNRKDREILKAELKINFKNFKKPEITMPKENIVLITADNMKVPIEFLNVPNELLIFKTKIKLEKAKTFFNYKIEIENALRNSQKTSMFNAFFVPEVYAFEAPEWLKTLLTTSVESESSNINSELSQVNKVKPESLEFGATADDIINAYKNEAESWKKDAQKSKGGPSFHSLIFECDEKSKLKSIKQSFLVYKGEVRTDAKNTDDQLISNGNGTYVFKSFFCPKGVRIDEKGRVGEGEGRRCPPQGGSIYEWPPFFEFTKVAAECCSDKNGCDKKVSTALNQIKQEMLSLGQSPASHSHSQ